jgi:hypothetical protein
MLELLTLAFRFQHAKNMQGGAVVGVKGTDSVILAVERRDVPKLQVRLIHSVAHFANHIRLVSRTHGHCGKW